MGCKCNQPSDTWSNYDKVVEMAQRMANLKQCNQVVFRTINGYMFNDEETFRGDKIEIVLQPQ